MNFSRGPHGEIFPPPLVAGASPEEALREMVGGDIYERMEPAERKAFYGEALLYIHQQNLRRALAGEMADDPDADALCWAVVQQGEPMSLRPLGMEEMEFKTFAPVLRRVGDDRWQVGIPDDGHHVILIGDAPSVLRQAQQLYVAWAEAETGG